MSALRTFVFVAKLFGEFVKFDVKRRVGTHAFYEEIDCDRHVEAIWNGTGYEWVSKPNK